MHCSYVRYALSTQLWYPLPKIVVVDTALDNLLEKLALVPAAPVPLLANSV